MSRRHLVLSAIAISLLSVGCSGTPTPTAQQYLADARNALKTSDFDTALKNLDQAIKSPADQPLGQQAGVLRVALVTALADAGKQMAEAYALGAKEPAAQSHFGRFNMMRSDYYGAARSRLMDAMQSVMDQRRRLSGNPIRMEVSFPGFTEGTDPTVVRIKSGQWVADAERLAAELRADRDALARILSGIAGAGVDTDKGQQIFSDGPVDIDSRVYIIELSSAFLQIGAMFESRALNELDHLRTVNEVVRDNLEVAVGLLTAKPDKVLEARVKKMQTECQKTLKKFRT